MTIYTDDQRATLLVQLRGQLKHVRVDFKDLGFGYEVLDAVSELRDFVEFELDELGVEYE